MHTHTAAGSYNIYSSWCKEALVCAIKLFLTSKIPTIDSILNARTLLITIIIVN